MMELYLIRHGIAVDLGTVEHDRDRPLTDQGRQRTGRVAQRLLDLGLECDLILTSSFRRAQQTAEILYAAGLGAALEPSELLIPDSAIAPWLDWLERWPQRAGGRLALVGHEPSWGLWTEQLVWGAPRGQLQVKKAGVIGLALPDQGPPLGNSELFWLAPPRLLL